MLGTSDAWLMSRVCPIDPAYYIEDCQIFIEHEAYVCTVVFKSCFNIGSLYKHQHEVKYYQWNNVFHIFTIGHYLLIE